MKAPFASWLAPVAPTVAVEIAAGRVAVAEVTGPAAAPVVSAFAVEPLPPGAVVPALAGPNVPDAAAVADALRRALDRSGLRPPRRAALVVPDSVARVTILTLEQVPARSGDLDQLLRWQLRKSTPFPIDDAVVSAVRLHALEGGQALAAVAARRDVVAQYEAVPAALGIHAGLVDLASFNVLNTLLRGGAGAAGGDGLLVCLAADATTLAIVRAGHLMFYRHRTALEEEPLGALVHQTAMFHQDRLGGTRFARVWLAGAAAGGREAEAARREIGERLGVAAEAVDVRPVAALRDRIQPGPDVLDVLAAPVGILLRNRKAA